MKCPSCGAENSSGTRECGSCGTLLYNRTNMARIVEPKRELAPKTVGGPPGDVRGESDRPVDHKDIPGRLKFDYLHCLRDPNQRCLEGLQALLARFREPRMNLDALLNDAANLISKQLGIDNVSIGLRDPDGLYRYRAMAGFRDTAVEGHKQIAYKREQFFANSHFIGTDISKLSRLYLAEDNELSDEERTAYNRPVLLAMKRRSLTESLEGDYIDTKILGPGDDLVGWIEISGTRTMKLPDAPTLRWVETIASAIAAALVIAEPRKDFRVAP